MTLAEARKRAGYTQFTAAEKLNLSPSNIYFMESGRNDITLTKAKKIADAYGCKVTEIEWPRAGRIE